MEKQLIKYKKKDFIYPNKDIVIFIYVECHQKYQMKFSLVTHSYILPHSSQNNILPL